MPIAFITESLAIGFNNEENKNIALREDYIFFLVPIGLEGGEGVGDVGLGAGGGQRRPP